MVALKNLIQNYNSALWEKQEKLEIKIYVKLYHNNSNNNNYNYLQQKP